MRESCTSGSVRGALSNERPYRDRTSPLLGFFDKWYKLSKVFSPFPGHTTAARHHGQRESWVQPFVSDDVVRQVAAEAEQRRRNTAPAGSNSDHERETADHGKADESGQFRQRW